MQNRLHNSSALRVLNVLFEDRYGGPQKRVIHVAKSLYKHGVQTVLCLPAGDGDTTDVGKKAGITVRHIAIERIPRAGDLRRLVRSVAFLPRDMTRFVALFRNEHPNLVHVNGAFFVAPAIAAKLTRIPLVWHLNDTIVPRRVAAVLGRFVKLLANQIVVAAQAVALHYGLPWFSYEVKP